MGYFSNSTEHAMYTEEYCNKCLNFQDGTCPIMDLHWVWNYDAVGSKDADLIKKAALDNFIPREGVFNDQCKMFLEAK